MMTIEEIQAKAEPTFDSMQELAKISFEGKTELSLKLALKIDSESIPEFKVIKGREQSIDPFTSSMSLPNTIQCLTSHTHYQTEVANPLTQIFLSDGDLDNIFQGTDQPQIGSFFIPNQYGITFVVNLAKCGSTGSDQGYYWTRVNDKETQNLGFERDIVKSFESSIEPIQFNVYWTGYNYVADVLFLPYQDLAKFTKDTGVNLTDITHGEGLPKLANYFSPDFAEQNPPKNLYELAVKRKEIFGLE
jgi:hypothetical protein